MADGGCMRWPVSAIREGATADGCLHGVCSVVCFVSVFSECDGAESTAKSLSASLRCVSRSQMRSSAEALVSCRIAIAEESRLLTILTERHRAVIPSFLIGALHSVY